MMIKLDEDDTTEAVAAMKTKLPQMQTTLNWKILFRLKMTLHHLKVLTSMNIVTAELDDVAVDPRGVGEGETVNLEMKAKKQKTAKKKEITNTRIHGTVAHPPIEIWNNQNEDIISTTTTIITTETTPQQLQLQRLCHPRQTMSKKNHPSFCL